MSQSKCAARQGSSPTCHSRCVPLEEVSFAHSNATTDVSIGNNNPPAPPIPLVVDLRRVPILGAQPPGVLAVPPPPNDGAGFDDVPHHANKPVEAAVESVGGDYVGDRSGNGGAGSVSLSQSTYDSVGSLVGIDPNTVEGVRAWFRWHPSPT